MGNFFYADNVFTRFMSRIFDLILLNLLWVITSIPIITIGASTTALYTVCFKMHDDGNSGIFIPYFLAFKENFLKATILWLIILAFGAVSIYNIFLCLSMNDASQNLTPVFVIFLMMALFLFLYAFPLQSRFENKIRYTLFNALFLSLRFLPRSLLMAAMFLFPVALLFVNLNWFIEVGIFWFVLYVSAVVYLSTLLLKKVFAFLISKNEDE